MVLELKAHSCPALHLPDSRESESEHVFELRTESYTLHSKIYQEPL